MARSSERFAPMAITGVGLCSSMGDAITACAAARAGLSRPTELDFAVRDEELEDDVSITGHPAPTAAAFRERGRLIALGEQALADLLCGLRDVPEERTLGFHLTLTDQATMRFAPDDDGQADAYAQRASAAESARADARERQEIADEILAIAGLDLPGGHRRVYGVGSPGLALALSDASLAFQQGELEACLVGAVDSLIHRPTLEYLYDGDRLKGPEHPNGLMPGEAGAFLLLEPLHLLRRQGRAVLGTITAVASGQGEDPDEIDHPPRGLALRDVYGQLAAAAGPLGEHGLWFITDQNGEVFRAHEWGDFLLRGGRKFPEIVTAPLWLPAVSFGDVGAASATLGLIMAVRAFARDYAPAATAIVCTSAYEGARGGVRVDAPGSGARR